jgi:hypothetical protein
MGTGGQEKVKKSFFQSHVETYDPLCLTQVEI